MQLDELIRPVLKQDFFARYWEAELLLISRKQPDYLSSLFGLRELDRLLGFHPTDARIQLAGAKKKRNGATATAAAAEDVSDLAGVYESFYQGRTLIVNGLHRLWEPVSQLCRNLLMETGMKTHANLYITPGRATGFDCHWDGHDVMILQLEGTKKWRLYPAIPWLPRPSSPGSAYKREKGKPALDVTLQAGDFLYLPRGTPHQATSGDGPSVHLTVGLMATTWEDLLVAAVQALSTRNEPLRKSLPHRWLSDTESLEPWLNTYREFTKELFNEHNVEDALALLGMEILEGEPFLPDGHFTQLSMVDRIDLSTTVQPRSGNLMRIVRSGEQVVLFFPGGSCAGPGKLFWAFEFMAETKSFKVADIPGWYSDEERLTIVRNLVRKGFLRIVSLVSPDKR
jgi:ribosomal protein L16 Arg81 hydroxylase